ncbi:hypothetical protein F0562_016863 [Nyssa sinensis]|uniref:ATP-dependent RNA helicase n=1 Tax=Nyssa sinensis TaxID=561372 RepID=A0A5J4ZF51_9ASTE|nr:hypothetical protein F0562_016863 [Nyssa sinensis]
MTSMFNDFLMRGHIFEGDNGHKLPCTNNTTSNLLMAVDVGINMNPFIEKLWKEENKRRSKLIYSWQWLLAFTMVIHFNSLYRCSHDQDSNLKWGRSFLCTLRTQSADLCRQAVADFTENYSSATIVVAVSAMIAVGQQRPTTKTDAEAEAKAVAAFSSAPALPGIKQLEIKGRWGDVADEVPDELEVPSISDDKTTSEIKLDSLAIDENKKVNKFLDKAEDSNIKAVTSGDTLYSSMKTIEDLNLSSNLKGLAHSGSGKTTCFVLGMLSRVDLELSAPQVLCICPTRELAIQNMEVLLKMGKYTGITAECAVPMDSSNYNPILKRAPVTAQVVIGTPGAVFNLLCNDWDKSIMSKIEQHFNIQIAEVGSWKSEEDFEDALKKADEVVACILATVLVDVEEAEFDNSPSASTKWNFFEVLYQSLPELGQMNTAACYLE